MKIEETLNKGSKANKITVYFKKTVQVRAYESEVVEGSTEVEVPEGATLAEVAVMRAIAQAELEYTLYVNLLVKGYVSQNEFNTRKHELEQSIDLLKTKCGVV